MSVDLDIVVPVNLIVHSFKILIRIVMVVLWNKEDLLESYPQEKNLISSRNISHKPSWPDV